MQIRSTVTVPIGSFALAMMLAVVAGPPRTDRLARAQGDPSGPCVPPASKKKCKKDSTGTPFQKTTQEFDPATLADDPPEGFPGLKKGEAAVCDSKYGFTFAFTNELLRCKNKDGTCTVVAHALTIDVTLNGKADIWLPNPGSTAVLTAHEEGHAAIAEAGYDALVQKMKKEVDNAPELSAAFTAPTCKAAEAQATKDLEDKIKKFVADIVKDANAKSKAANDAYDDATGKGTIGDEKAQAKAAKDQSKLVKKAILGE